ncbi:MAG: UPF0001 protein [Acidimicrobiia bacterium]|nr:MAG: UPF0001 protein [Acidimicrobiia bacterium]
MGLDDVASRIVQACVRSGRDPGEVSLVVVTKGRTVDEIAELYRLGHRVFGENRAQELADKHGRLPRDVEWHFVGPLQTNKVRLVRPVVRLLHSLDRRSLAEAWMKGPGKPPPALLQVNVGREPQKHGVDPADVDRVCDEFLALGVPLVGVMAIPPIPENPEASRPYFRRLREIRDRLRRVHPQIRELSMGMSDDFEVAVEEGATIVRVGRAIFEP